MRNARAYKCLWFTLLIMVSTTSWGVAAASVIDEKMVTELSSNALTNYIKHALTKENVTAFGFKNLEEAQSARVGRPYPVMTIDLAKLKAYKPKSGVKAIATEPDILWFPVMVGNETRAKLEMVRHGDQWIPGEFGNVGSAKEVAAAAAMLSQPVASKAIGADYTTSMVRIPVLLAELLYVKSTKGEFLIPAMVNPERYKLRNGSVYQADEVLTKLSKIAAKIKEGTIH